MTDGDIIDLFFARSQQAIEELDTKYGKVCRRLAGNLLGNRDDGEECVNDAYLGIWNAIPPARPDPLLTFLCKIVRNLSLKRVQANRAAKRDVGRTVALDELEGCLTAADTAESAVEERELVRWIEGFLDGLPQENRVLFLRRYWFADSYQDIAARMGLSEKNVSVRLTRIRKQLGNYLKERGVKL